MRKPVGVEDQDIRRARQPGEGFQHYGPLAEGEKPRDVRKADWEFCCSALPQLQVGPGQHDHSATGTACFDANVDAADSLRVALQGLHDQARAEFLLDLHGLSRAHVPGMGDHGLDGHSIITEGRGMLAQLRGDWDMEARRATGSVPPWSTEAGIGSPLRRPLTPESPYSGGGPATS